MYTGEYIENNIGHEILNFFKPDNIDSYYGYITYNGKVDPKKADKILFVSNIKGRKVKVLAKIKNPEFIINTDEGNTYKKQIEYIKKEDIRHNNVLFSESCKKMDQINIKNKKDYTIIDEFLNKKKLERKRNKRNRGNKSRDNERIIFFRR